eukprot:TRINITY_DN16169_c0_g1_i11.p1 TRINITY_DN16169_c0_g1~~TRINITY_DN16169_c0_g1_i11.p1  ORF type:complete len:136 (+),score=5.09 TRINITY_DN16169_c0_g1_i11:256-663(+)
MKNITMSEESYKEFKSFLEENNISDFNIRINFSGFACSGPIFNISVSKATDADEVEKVNDISFICEKNLIDQFGGFIILSSKENDGNGLSLKPVIAPEGGGCGTCSGCHQKIKCSIINWAFNYLLSKEISSVCST